MHAASILAVLLLCAPAHAQAVLYGGPSLYRTDTADFLGNHTVIGGGSGFLAMDFDATGSTLWTVGGLPPEYGTIDLETGEYKFVGLISGATFEVTGITASPDGVTWYLVRYNAGSSRLFRGNFETGMFTRVGYIASDLVLGIAIDSQNNLYGHALGADVLLSIDTETGFGTVIGPTTLPANGPQGMDFDWSTDTLYGTFNLVGLVRVFASMNTETGAATIIQPLDVAVAIAAMTLQVAAPELGKNYCVSTPNSTGQRATITATGSESVASQFLALRVVNLPPSTSAIFYYGVDRRFVPFGNGFQCVGGTLQRLSMDTADFAGSLVEPDVFSHPMPDVPILPGTMNFQTWYRDPLAGGSGSDLSDAVAIEFVP